MGAGSKKLQFTLPSPPSGEEDEGLISLHGVRGIASVVHHLGIKRSPLCPDGGEVKSSFATKTRTSTKEIVGGGLRPAMTSNCKRSPDESVFPIESCLRIRFFVFSMLDK
ncbi:MAG: hypothetical protein DMG05_00935 [Acidobacteria bacterium]|nr:MAG: hypothetical protein DMG05_00935 [Acidobacteriota bacterium]